MRIRSLSGKKPLLILLSVALVFSVLVVLWERGPKVPSAPSPVSVATAIPFEGWSVADLQIDSETPDAVPRVAKNLRAMLEGSQQTRGAIKKIELMATTPRDRFYPPRIEVSSLRDREGVCVSEFSVYEIKSDLTVVSVAEMSDCCEWEAECALRRVPLDWLYSFSRLPASELPKYWDEKAGEPRLLGPSWYVWNCDESFTNGQALCKVDAPGETVTLTLEWDGTRARVVSVDYADE